MASLKSPRLCVYCNLSKRMSGEHIIADWVKNVIPRETNSHTVSSIQVYRNMPGPAIISPRMAFGKGHLGTRQLKWVCLDCNGGWLKAIQDAAKPILAPLITGTWENISAEKMLILATWVCMTVINIDFADFGGSGIPKDDRAFFHLNKRPPDNWKIWVGKRTGGDGMAVYHRPICLHQLGTPLPTGKNQGRNSQITTVEIGQVVLHAISSPASMPIVTDNMTYGQKFGVIPIFPLWGGDVLDWRRAPVLNDDDIDLLANYIVREMMKRPIE